MVIQNRDTAANPAIAKPSSDASEVLWEQTEGIIKQGELLETEDCSLLVLDGPHEGLRFHLTQETTRIGRNEWCDIPLPQDGKVSGQHCECSLEAEGVRLKDLGSRNGTFLHECAIRDVLLGEGSVFKVGDTSIQLVYHRRRKNISLPYQDDSGMLVGRSLPMRKIFAMLKRIKQRDVMTLLMGETGTGKSCIAESIHMMSARSKQPFVVVNCGALPADLIEAALFGHEKGAFTGAFQQSSGFFEQADGGTLFLDEIAELPLELQPKLLDILERRKFRRVGGKKELNVDFRLLSATHRNLHKEVEEGRFREDLYFRIAVIELEVPPLRDRLEDLSLLVESLLKLVSPEETYSLTSSAMRKLQGYLWPGNIRELRNLLERTITFLEGTIIDAEDIFLPLDMKADQSRFQDEVESPLPALIRLPLSSSLTLDLKEPLQETPIALKQTMSHMERELIVLALQNTNYNVQQASTLLGISAPWLYNRIQKYNLRPEPSEE